MPSLFEYHFKKSLQQAVTQLSLDCQKSDGSDHQKDFNTKVQIRLMNETLAKILLIEIADSPNWFNFKKDMKVIIDEAKLECANAKGLAQQESGETILITLFENFGNKLLAIFDELRANIETPTFLLHDNRPAHLYTSQDYSSSDFLSQLINIAISYRFNKIQEKHVNDSKTFSSKHFKKWPLITNTIDTWTKHIANKSLSINEYKDTIEGVLTKLITKEQVIQYEKGDSLLGQIRGFGLWAVSLYTEEPDDLRVILPKLLARFERGCITKPKSIASASAIVDDELLIDKNALEEKDNKSMNLSPTI